jgi:hypothetical protein
MLGQKRKFVNSLFQLALLHVINECDLGRRGPERSLAGHLQLFWAGGLWGLTQGRKKPNSGPTSLVGRPSSGLGS